MILFRLTPDQRLPTLLILKNARNYGLAGLLVGLSCYLVDGDDFGADCSEAGDRGIFWQCQPGRVDLQQRGDRISYSR